MLRPPRLRSPPTCYHYSYTPPSSLLASPLSRRYAGEAGAKRLFAQLDLRLCNSDPSSSSAPYREKRRQLATLFSMLPDGPVAAALAGDIRGALGDADDAAVRGVVSRARLSNAAGAAPSAAWGRSPEAGNEAGAAAGGRRVDVVVDPPPAASTRGRRAKAVATLSADGVVLRVDVTDGGRGYSKAAPPTARLVESVARTLGADAQQPLVVSLADVELPAPADLPAPPADSDALVPLLDATASPVYSADRKIWVLPTTPGGIVALFGPGGHAPVTREDPLTSDVYVALLPTSDRSHTPRFPYPRLTPPPPGTRNFSSPAGCARWRPTALWCLWTL